jgi:hypothetical protein
MNESVPAEIRESTILEKFEGDPSPENLIERIHIEDGEIIRIDKFENGEPVSTQVVKEVE